MVYFINIVSLPIDIKSRANVYDSSDQLIKDNDCDHTRKLLNDLIGIISRYTRVKLICDFLKEWFVIDKSRILQVTEAIRECLIYNAKRGDWLEESFYTYFGEKLIDHVDPKLREITFDIDGKRKCIKNYNL